MKFAPNVRRAMREAYFANARAGTGCIGTVVCGAIVLWQALIIADSSGGPEYAPLYEANAVVRWTLSIAALFWILSFFPFAVRVRRAAVWSSLALVLGSGIGWFLWPAIHAGLT
jgi:hypothetical protein